MNRLLTLTALTVVLAVPCLNTHAQDRTPAAVPADEYVPGQSAGYFSWRLGARFELQQMQTPGYTFVAARIVSQPVQGSPLHQLGLSVGDVITRLDGTRVVDYGELDRHHRHTHIRYIKTGTYQPVNGQIRIPRHYVFNDNQSPYFDLAPVVQTP